MDGKDGRTWEPLPYDDSDADSILRYADRLTGRTLGDFVETGEILFGDAHTKGRFGQIVEKEYFRIPNNSLPEPDFSKVGMELKVAPMVRRDGELVSKERLVLSIIDYNKVPVMGFDTFLHKGAHILIVFYLWEEGADILSYRFLKCVDWRPTDEELRIIREDWDVIEDYIMRGEADLLSERHTRYLAANTKGAGHGRDMRTQPFSDRPAKQRSLSFKASFMTSLYSSHADVGELLVDRAGEIDDMASATVFNSVWVPGQTFEAYILSRFGGFVGMTCAEIEEAIGAVLNPDSKQYYHALTLAMLGILKRRRVKEFDEAGIIVKTVRIKADGTPKESMSFRAIRYDRFVNETWETSEFLSDIDHEFLIPVFQFGSRSDGRRDLVFRGAFFWRVPDADMDTIRGVWEDTREKVDRGDFDHFVKGGDDRIAHVRPKARNSADTFTFRGREAPKKCFWFNARYIKGVIERNLLSRPRSPRGSVPSS